MKYEMKEQYFFLFKANLIIMMLNILILEYFLFHRFSKLKVNNHCHFSLFLYFNCYNPIQIAFALFKILCCQLLIVYY